MAEAGFALAFLAGMISFLSPCIVPMIIVYLTTITGFSFKQLIARKQKKDLKNRVFYSTLVFAASFAIAFTLMGFVFGSIGAIFIQSQRALEFIAGILFALLALHLLGLFKIGFLNKMKCELEAGLGLQMFKRSGGGLTNAGIFVIGFFFALVCSHCLPVLLPTLIAAAASASASTGTLMMLAFSIGLAIPFLITSLFLEAVFNSLERLEKHYRKIEIAIALVLLAFAAVLLSGNYLAFVTLLMRLIPWRIGAM